MEEAAVVCGIWKTQSRSAELGATLNGGYDDKGKHCPKIWRHSDTTEQERNCLV